MVPAEEREAGAVPDVDPEDDERLEDDVRPRKRLNAARDLPVTPGPLPWLLLRMPLAGLADTGTPSLAAPITATLLFDEEDGVLSASLALAGAQKAVRSRRRGVRAYSVWNGCGVALGKLGWKGILSTVLRVNTSYIETNLCPHNTST